LLPDQTPPLVTLMIPGSDTVPEVVTLLQARFNEPLDFQSVTPLRVRLLSAGPDLVFGNADDQSVAGLVGYSGTALAAQMEFDAPLPPGRYRFEVDGLRDLAGNVQVVPASSQFWVAPGGPTGDPDGDGLINAEESAAGTSPFAEDTDGDGWADEVEVHDASDPRDPVSRPDSVIWGRPPVALLRASPAEVLPATPVALLASPPVIVLRAATDETVLPGPFLARPPVAVSVSAAGEEAPPGPFLALPPVGLRLGPTSEEAPSGPHVARPPVSLKRN